eukprot:scaffold12924_cov125-Isochrysis_galbana.AAC.1
MSDTDISAPWAAAISASASRPRRRSSSCLTLNSWHHACAAINKLWLRTRRGNAEAEVTGASCSTLALAIAHQVGGPRRAPGGTRTVVRLATVFWQCHSRSTGQRLRSCALPGSAQAAGPLDSAAGLGEHFLEGSAKERTPAPSGPRAQDLAAPPHQARHKAATLRKIAEGNGYPHAHRTPAAGSSGGVGRWLPAAAAAAEEEDPVRQKQDKGPPRSPDIIEFTQDCLGGHRRS